MSSITALSLSLVNQNPTTGKSVFHIVIQWDPVYTKLCTEQLIHTQITKSAKYWYDFSQIVDVKRICK